MRLLLLFGGTVGERVLDWLLSTFADDLVGVVAAEDDAALDRARRAGVPTLVACGSAEIAAFAAGLRPVDLGVTAWWPALLKPPLIGLPRGGFLNFHPSLLPHDRGKHYNFWTLVEQSPFGVTLHLIDDGIDTGPIVAQRPLDHGWLDTGGSLHARAADAMVTLFQETYPRLRDRPVMGVPQEPGAGSFHRAAELEPASRIDLDATYRARDLLNLLRARTFPGHPGCWFEDDGVLYEARISIAVREPDRAD